MNWPTDLIGLCAALLISVVTTPTGVSGAVFLLPVQLSVLQVPNPAVTPTNLLYNVVAGPGALIRHARNGSLWSPLARLLILGALPGVVLGAVTRVYLVADPDVFRLCVAALLAPLGIWLMLTPRARPSGRSGLGDRSITALAVVGFVGGIYGVGGGSLLGPILVGTGLAVATVAPAALLSTFATSVVGALAYVVLSIFTPGTIAPDWSLGLACGVGGLIGGYIGATLQPYLPELGLRRLLGLLATALAGVYLVQALT